MPSEGARLYIKYAPIQSGNTEWMLKAECRGVPMKDGYSIFFPKISKSPGRPTRKGHHEAPLTEFYQEAIEFCARCPVVSDCQDEYSRDPIPKDGMFFGKTPSQRTRLRTNMNEALIAVLRELVPHGVDIQDSSTEDAKRINNIHRALWGTSIPGYPDGFWE